jgi:hypothetical protein
LELLVLVWIWILALALALGSFLFAQMASRGYTATTATKHHHSINTTTNKPS